MSHHPTYTDPITYWTSDGCGNIYSQVDSSHLCQVEPGDIAPNVEVTGLIAAAPELLDALKRFQSAGEDGHALRRARDAAQAVLDKVHGLGQ